MILDNIQSLTEIHSWSNQCRYIQWHGPFDIGFIIIDMGGYSTNYHNLLQKTRHVLSEFITCTHLANSNNINLLNWSCPLFVDRSNSLLCWHNDHIHTVKSRTDGVYALVYRTYVVDRRRSYWSQLAVCGGEISSKSTVAQTKMGHVRKTTPLLGVICHPFGKT